MSNQSSSVIKALVWKVGERVMVQGVGLLVQVILARLLMPKDFAQLAVITAIVNYLGLFVQSGLSVAVVQKKNLSDKDLSTLSTISFLVASLMFLALFFVAPSISRYYNLGDLVWPIRVMGITLFLYAFNSIQTGLLQRKMMFRAIFFRSMLATPLSGAVGIILANLGFGIWALIAFLLSNILTVVIFMNMITELRIKFGFSVQSAKELYSFSIKILVTSLISSGSDTIRLLTIGKRFTPSQLAYFDRGLSYSGLVTQIVNSSLSTVLLSVFSRSQDDQYNLKLIARRSIRMSSFVMFPILSLVALVSEPLVYVVLSEKWVPCAIYLSIFCILRLPGIISTCDKQVYYAIGKSQIGLYYEIFLLALNLTSLFILIQYGVLAVAIGFTIVEYVGNLVLFIISSKLYNYSLIERFSDLSKPFLNTIVMVVVLYSMKLFIENPLCLLLLQIAIGFLTYILMSYITKDSNLSFLVQKLKPLNNKYKL